MPSAIPITYDSEEEEQAARRWCYEVPAGWLAIQYLDSSHTTEQAVQILFSKDPQIERFAIGNVLHSIHSISAGRWHYRYVYRAPTIEIVP